jgi:hypothetical protein
MYYSYVEIEYVATSFSPARTDLAVKLLITHVHSEENLSDIMTKVTCSSKHCRLVGKILYNVYDDHPK